MYHPNPLLTLLILLVLSFHAMRKACLLFGQDADGLGMCSQLFLLQTDYFLMPDGLAS